MVVRVRIRIMRENKVVETITLASSGYEAETPQLLVPVMLAEELGLWPPIPGMEESEFETAGGPLKVWIAPRACKVKVVAEDVEGPEVIADIVVSPVADEVLLSDKLLSKLQIALEDPGEGLWRFRWELKEKVRRSEPPRRWK